ncbi:tyrosine-type recombinase/integrase [Isobaculum melis]|uniref:hypothetical protein n=1 Tax=Isobaculum melis TaxID=142588 RepID=UPI000B8731F8
MDGLIKDIKIGKNKNLTFNEVATEWLKKYKHTVKAKTATTREYTLNLLNKIIPKDYLITKIDTLYIQELSEKFYYEEDYSYNVCKTS